MDRFWLPPCEIFGLRPPNSEVCGLCGTVNDDLQEGLCQGGPLGLLLPEAPPWGETQLSHASTGDCPTLGGRSGSISCGVNAPFLWVLVRARFCLCPPRVLCLFPLLLWKSYNQIPLPFKVRCPGDSQPLCHIPRMGTLM